MKLPRQLKYIISILMLALVLYLVDFSALKNTLLNIPPYLIASVILLYTVGQILSAYKWWIIATSGRIKASYLVALKSYFIGMYVNCFGFGTVGGDVARGVILGSGRSTKTEAIVSVLADRFHGLAVLATLAIFATLITQYGDTHPLLLYGLYFMAISIVTGWIVGPKLLLRFIPKENRFREKIENALAHFPKKPSKIFYITILSLLFHLLQITIHVIIAKALNLNIPLSMIFVAIPFVNILGSLPISWQGLGVRETAYIFFLGDYITNEQAVAIGALWFLGVTTSSAIGGIISTMTGDLKEIKMINEKALAS